MGSVLLNGKKPPPEEPTMEVVAGTVVVTGTVVVAVSTSDERVVEVGVASLVVPPQAPTTNTHTTTAVNRLISRAFQKPRSSATGVKLTATVGAPGVAHEGTARHRVVVECSVQSTNIPTGDLGADVVD